YFEENAIMSLTAMENIEKVMIVCDPGMVELGYTKTVEKVLNQRPEQPHIKVFSDVEPNPSTNTVYKGLEMMIDFQPDTIIALGGGS
ncbi:iron-containing alcohol dehydrogenase, partial [Staphylococcus aureus]